MENIQLLPCPFCGGEAVKSQSDYESYVSYTVECCDCGCEVRQTGSYNESDKTQAQAIFNWNTRASGWVSVADALPENEGKYLVFDQSGRTKIAEFCKKHSAIYHKWYELGFAPLPTVTHWQPMPQPPKSN